MTRVLTLLLLCLTLTASAQTWTNPSAAMWAASNAVAFQSTAPMLHLVWDWTNIPDSNGSLTWYPTNIAAVILGNTDLRTTNWTTVWQGVGTNCWVFATNQMGFFRATSAYVNQ